MSGPATPKHCGTIRHQPAPTGTKRNETEPNGTIGNESEPFGPIWNAGRLPHHSGRQQLADSSLLLARTCCPQAHPMRTSAQRPDSCHSPAWHRSSLFKLSPPARSAGGPSIEGPTHPFLRTSRRGLTDSSGQCSFFCSDRLRHHRRGRAMCDVVPRRLPRDRADHGARPVRRTFRNSAKGPADPTLAQGAMPLRVVLRKGMPARYDARHVRGPAVPAAKKPERAT